MTAQTAAYIKGTLLGLGQGPNTITPLRMEDIADSVVFWDDPANVSTLGAPATVRGTISTYGLVQSGQLVAGTGQTLTTRQNNATALQTFFDKTASMNVWAESPPNTFEISSSVGLKILPSGGSGFRFRGDKAETIINQFYTTSQSAPVLTIGDPTNANFTQDVDIEGMWLNYGAAVTGLTSANALCVGALGWSNLGKIQVGTPNPTTPLNPAYRGIYIYAGGSGQSFFSNSLNDIVVNGGQLELLNWTQAGTGNVADNIYLQGGAGAGTWPAVTLPLNMNMVQNTTENDIRELNIEWLSTNKAVDMENCFGLTVRHLHFEGVKMTGASPILILTAGDTLTIDQLTLVDVLIQSANLTGTPSVILSFQPSNDSIIVNQLTTVFNSTGEINTAIALYNLLSPGAGISQFKLNGARLPDAAGGNLAGHFSLDAHMPTSGSQFLVPAVLGEYRWGMSGSRVAAATINVAAAYTHYGQLEDSVLILAATGTYNLTLADTMGASGTQLPRYGNTVTILRPTYTSGTVTIKDGAGTTITTNSSTTSVVCQFNPTASPTVGIWATVTPVT